MRAPQGWQLLILLIAVLLLFGANRLPGAARSLGRSLRIFKSEVKELGKDDDDPDDLRVERDGEDRHRDGRIRDDERRHEQDRDERDRHRHEQDRERDSYRDDHHPDHARPRDVAAPGEARRDR